MLADRLTQLPPQVCLLPRRGGQASPELFAPGRPEAGDGSHQSGGCACHRQQGEGTSSSSRMGPGGLSGEEGSGVRTQAFRVTLGLGLALGRVGGLSERTLPPSMSPASLSSCGVSGSALGQPSVLGSGCLGREAATGMRPLTRGTLSGLAVLPSSGGRPALVSQKCPGPGALLAVRVLLLTALAAGGEGGGGSRPVGSVSAPTQEPSAAGRTLLSSWVSLPTCSSPRDTLLGLTRW